MVRPIDQSDRPVHHLDCTRRSCAGARLSLARQELIDNCLAMVTRVVGQHLANVQEPVDSFIDSV